MVQAGMYYCLPGKENRDTLYAAVQTATGAVVLVNEANRKDQLLVVRGRVFNKQMVSVCGEDDLYLMRV